MGLSASRDSIPSYGNGSSSGESGAGVGISSSSSSADGGEDNNDNNSSSSAATFTWDFGGQCVFVTGSWDNWEKKTPLVRDPASGVHSARLVMPVATTTNNNSAHSTDPVAVFSYKFFVDGNWQCSPAHPTRTDDRGNTNNYLAIPLFPPPASRKHRLDETDNDNNNNNTNSLVSPSAPGISGDVPVLPRLLAPTKNVRKTNSIAPHIFVDRLFCSQGDPKVKTLSLQSRYKAKIITTIFVTPA